jgi:GAF domain-containing protein
VAFDSPCALNGIYVGGAPATAAWGQSWRGAVAELILLADTPTDERLNALRRYLALKHGLAVPTESDGGIVATLAAMGVDTDGLFNSVFLVK